MVSIYDVFYIVAKNGAIRIKDIVKALDKSDKEYQIIFNCVLSLEKKHLVTRKKTVQVINSDSSKQLFDLISFCLHNNMNYNLLFKDKALYFIEKASKKEFFTIVDIPIHAETFKFYTDALSKYGLLLIISRNPLKCKLLKSEFTLRVLKYFKKNHKFYLPKKRSHIIDITRELKKYHRAMRTYGISYDTFESKRRSGFVYSSLNLEGNPLTLPETEKLLIEDIVPENQKLEFIEETMNYKRAVDEMIINVKKKKRLDIALILSYHAIAMSRKNFAGKIRKENVYIKKNPLFETSDWKEIEGKLRVLMSKYEQFENSKKTLIIIISFAAYFHNEFQRIHPFIDGNSRISRLLMLHVLRLNGIPVLELPLGYFDSYLDLTKRSKKRDDTSFAYLVEEIVLTNLKNLNNSLLVYNK